MASPEALKQGAEVVKGVSPARREQLRRLGIETVGDLLLHFPRAYEEFGGLKKIGDLVEGQIQTVRSEVVSVPLVGSVTPKAWSLSSPEAILGR